MAAALRLGKGLSGIAAMQRGAGGGQLGSDWREQPNHPCWPLMRCSGVSLPLAYQDELLGVLTLESRRNRPFPPRMS